jgi:hypothetical protein
MIITQIITDKEINSKSETLNSKQIQNPKHKTPNVLSLELCVCNLFRI